MAQQWLLRSVRLNPYHWGAWEELAALLSSVDDLNVHLTSSILPQNIMTLFYQTHAYVDLFSTTDAPTTFSSLEALLRIFPSSTFLLTQLALSHYHAKDFETSASIFQDLLTTHPHRLDALDHYSNILYVMADRPSPRLPRTPLHHPRQIPALKPAAWSETTTPSAPSTRKQSCTSAVP